MSDHIREAVERAIYPGDGADPAEVETAVRAALARRKARAELPVKVCPACGRNLPTAAYANDTTRADGLDHTCRECRTLKARARRTPRPAQ